MMIREQDKEFLETFFLINVTEQVGEDLEPLNEISDVVARAVDLLIHGAVLDLDRRSESDMLNNMDAYALVCNWVLREMLDHGMKLERPSFIGETLPTIRFVPE